MIKSCFITLFCVNFQASFVEPPNMWGNNYIVSMSVFEKNIFLY